MKLEKPTHSSKIGVAEKDMFLCLECFEYFDNTSTCRYCSGKLPKLEEEIKPEPEPEPEEEKPEYYPEIKNRQFYYDVTFEFFGKNEIISVPDYFPLSIKRDFFNKLKLVAEKSPEEKRKDIIKYYKIKLKEFWDKYNIVYQSGLGSKHPEYERTRHQIRNFLRSSSKDFINPSKVDKRLNVLLHRHKLVKNQVHIRSVLSKEEHRDILKVIKKLGVSESDFYREAIVKELKRKLK